MRIPVAGKGFLFGDILEKELSPKFTIDEMRLDDIESATEMRLQSWLDTYVNDELGVTREWIEERNRGQLSRERVKSRRDRFLAGRKAGTFSAWVARDAGGNIIGSTTPFRDEDGSWRLGSLYVAKNWHGTGVANQLMQRAMDWLGENEDVHLGVVSYNERAKAFYRKWGFVEVPDSEELFDDLIPEVKMVRKAKV